MNVKISPSLMCADFLHLAENLRELEAAGAELLHMDIMDGHFVPNFTLGADFCRAVRRESSLPLDFHLMIEKPEDRLNWFPIAAGDYVSVHAESTAHLQKILTQIRALGAHPMVALNPATPICALEEVWEDLDGVLVMTVNPGFAGQKMIPKTLEKIQKIRDFSAKNGQKNTAFFIEADGNVSLVNAPKMVAAGADILVAGTSSVFRKDCTIAEGMAQLRQSCEGI